MTILHLILGVMLALTPTAYRPAEDTPRWGTYLGMARGIDEAVRASQNLPFDGPAAREAAAVALAVVARTESAFRQDVRDCSVKGDRGQSISTFQLMRGPAWQGHTAREICADDALAARLALDVFAWYETGPTVLSLFQGYAAGDPSRRSKEAQTQYEFFASQLAANNIRLTKNRESRKFYAEHSKEVLPLTGDVQKVRILAVAPGSERLRRCNSDWGGWASSR